MALQCISSSPGQVPSLSTGLSRRVRAAYFPTHKSVAIGKRKAMKGQGQPRNPKQPRPANPLLVEVGVMAEMSALSAWLAALEQANGLPLQPAPPQVPGTRTRYTRLAAYKQVHTDMLQQIVLLERAVTGPTLPLLPVEPPGEPVPPAVPDLVPQDPVQPQPMVPPPHKPPPSPPGDPVPPGANRQPQYPPLAQQAS